ncbi:hypothetical protein E2C01_034134 [Portunus trituberculatus]|uniref:Uncharacterized protein n=1 Tax=Portunus trituberculatus TaxID=210409 RepID=A0A5B7F671_PORTR|nr:hypothetical protein [Portunus trituberculatus]
MWRCLSKHVIAHAAPGRHSHQRPDTLSTESAIPPSYLAPCTPPRPTPRFTPSQARSTTRPPSPTPDRQHTSHS